MKRGVFWTNLFFAATVGGVGIGAATTPLEFAVRGVGQEAGSDDFRSIAPNEFELATDEKENGAAVETPTLELPAVPIEVDASTKNDGANAKTGENVASNPNVETLPPEAVVPPSSAETVVDDAEKDRLKNDPLFREFSAAFDEAAPLPTIPGLDSNPNFGPNGVTNGENGEFKDAVGRGDVDYFGGDGGGLPSPGAVSASESSGNLALALDSVLAISAVDLSSLEISPENRATLERLDAEISRLCPLWIDAELNKNVVGRRERIGRRNEPTRFETNEPEPVAVESDWALAPDAPFFFQVIDSASGDVFYTKAGDFEPIDGAPALVRDGGAFALAVEPGPSAPSGRAERTRVLIDGKIQGVDAAGKRVVDFNLGTISLYLFDNPSRLESADGVFFIPTSESGEPRLTKLAPTSKIGVRAGKLVLSNGRPDELLARIVVLCKSKKRLVEILTQPRLGSN